MGDVHDLEQERDRASYERFLRDIAATPGFKIGLDTTEIETHVTGHGRGEKNQPPERLDMVIYNVSGKSAEPLAAVRMRREQLLELIETASLLLGLQSEVPTFPRFLMVIDGKKKFLTLQQAGIVFDSGWMKVEVGGFVLEEDFSMRIITAEEGREISRIADEYSANK